MTRVKSRLGFAVLASISVVTSAASGAASSVAAHSTPMATPQQTGESLQRCKPYDILLLVDQSASLQSSDPDNLRINASQTFLDGLTNLGTDVTLSIAGFGSTVTPVQSFDLPGQRAEARGAIDNLATKPVDRNTDYVLAILAAVKYFEDNPQPAHCKTLIWFTDGAYDIEQAKPEYVGSYTSLTDPAVILEQFEAVVCGPVPSSFSFTEPLADQVREFEFVIELIDLRGSPTGSAVERRNRTDQVLDRLLTDGPDGRCGVDGRRIDVSHADEIVDVLKEQVDEIEAQEEQRRGEKARADFGEAQREAGRTEVDCSVLEGGIPATLVESIGAFATPATAEIKLSVGERIEIVEQKLDYDVPASDRLKLWTIKAEAINGELVLCFVTLSAAIEVLGEPQLYEGATETPTYFAVGGPGIAVAPSAGVGGDSVQLSATQDGQLLDPPYWNAEMQFWVVDIPTPSGTETLLEVTGDFTGQLSNRGVVSPFVKSIPVRDVPAVPQVRWTGDTWIEGAGVISGTFEVAPSADVDAEVCLDFPEFPTDLRNIADGTGLGRLNADTTTVCGPASEKLELPVTIDVNESSNATGTVDVPFTATFQPVDEDPKAMGSGTAIVPEFTLAKLVDSSVQLRLALILAAASALLTYLVMQALTALQAKLRSPDELLVVNCALETSPANGSIVRKDGAVPIPLSHFKQMTGSRTRYELGNGIILTRRLSLNPFAALSAVVQSSGPSVVAHPAKGPTTGNGRRVPVPLRFASLVLVTDDGRSCQGAAVVPIGTSPSATATIIDDGLRRLGSQLRDDTRLTRPSPDSADGNVTAEGTPTPSRSARRTEPEKPLSESTPSWAVTPSASSPPRPTRTPPPPPHRR